MFALFFMIAFVTGLQNPMGIIVKEQFQVPNWMSQLGNFANFIAYACMGIPAGIMLQRIGYKKTGSYGHCRRFRRRRDFFPVRTGRKFYRLSDRRFRIRFFDVYAERRGKPDAQYARGRR